MATTTIASGRKRPPPPPRAPQRNPVAQLRDQIQRVEEAARTTNTTRGYISVVEALQKEPAPSALGRNWRGELYAAGAELKDNNAAPAFKALLNKLREGLKRLSSTGENEPPRTARHAPVAGPPAARAAPARRQSLGGVNTGGADHAPPPQRAPAARPQKRPAAPPPPAAPQPRRGPPTRRNIEPTPVRTPDDTAPEVWAALSHALGDEFVLAAIAAGWSKERAKAEAERHFANLGVELSQEALAERLAAASINSQKVVRHHKRSARGAVRLFNELAAASDGWLAEAPAKTPIVALRRELRDVKKRMAAAAAAAGRARRAAPVSDVESLEASLTHGRKPISADILLKVYKFVAERKVSVNKAADILRAECSEKGITYSQTFCSRAITIVDLAVTKALRDLVKNAENLVFIHDGGSTTLGSTGFRFKFQAMFLGCRLKGDRPPRCAMAWAGNRAASHELALAARAAAHVPRHFTLEEPPSRPGNAWTFFAAAYDAGRTHADGRVQSALKRKDASQEWHALPEDAPLKLAARAAAAAAAAALAERRRKYDAALERAQLEERTATVLWERALCPDATGAKQVADGAFLYEISGGARPSAAGLLESADAVRKRWASGEANPDAVAACNAAAARLANERVAAQRSLLADSTGSFVSPRGNVAFAVPLEATNAVRRAQGLEPLAPAKTRAQQPAVSLDPKSWRPLFARGGATADAVSAAGPALHAPPSPPSSPPPRTSRGGRAVKPRYSDD